MKQMTKYYWGMLAERAAAAGTTTHGSSGEPSWEELAFARDSAGHLAGGCVWPPRSYTCNFCRREFRSAQALGGHMNVYRRDRARLRQCQCASPDRDQDALQQQPNAAPPADHHHQDQQEAPSLFIRAKAVLLPNPKSTCCDHGNYYSKEEEATISTCPSYLSTIIKEAKNKVVISIPPKAARRKEALESNEEGEAMAETRKRRRVGHQLQAKISQETEVLKVITSPSPNSIHLVGWQEVDLELRLGSPKVK